MFNLAAQVASMASVAAAGATVSTPLSPGFGAPPQNPPSVNLAPGAPQQPPFGAVFRFFPPPPHNPAASAAFLSAAFPSAFQPRQSKLSTSLFFIVFFIIFKNVYLENFRKKLVVFLLFFSYFLVTGVLIKHRFVKKS